MMMVQWTSKELSESDDVEESIADSIGCSASTVCVTICNGDCGIRDNDESAEGDSEDSGAVVQLLLLVWSADSTEGLQCIFNRHVNKNT
jgi:hypothetical protein